MKRTVVIGLGNPILGDDGVGLEVARRIKNLSEGTGAPDVKELGAGGLRLLEAMAGYDRAFIVDAMVSGRIPQGAARFMTMEELGPARNVASEHDLDLPTAVEMGKLLGMDLPGEIRIMGIEASNVHAFGESLTAELRESVPGAVDSIMKELAGT